MKIIHYIKLTGAHSFTIIYLYILLRIIIGIAAGRVCITAVEGTNIGLTFCCILNVSLSTNERINERTRTMAHSMFAVHRKIPLDLFVTM